MKHVFAALAALLLTTGALAQEGININELEAALRQAETAQQRAAIHYQIGQAYLRSNAERALEHGKHAYDQAVVLKNEGLAARTAYLNAQAYERLRKDSHTDTWLRTALSYAKQAGDADLIIQSVDKRSRLATKDRNYRRAYEINQEAFNYFSANGTSIADLQARFELDKAQIEREKRELERTRTALQSEIEILREEQQLLDEENEKLATTNERKTQQLVRKEEEISSISQEKAAVEELVATKEQEVKNLSRDALEKQAAYDQAMRELAEKDLAVANAQLEAQTSRNLRNYAGILTAFMVLLALLLYNRFRAKRRAAVALEEKNGIIEEERRRSDELLLNILPASIAAELKEHGQAQAQHFDETTVLFSDFKNFTGIAEQLTPAELVEELDRCFKAFDRIIGQYPDIEKIKTIGDAYMCASGLSRRAGSPHNLVRAALEMQAWLEEEKENRTRQGKPSFEARIGLHTGPVVAGVVGSKKFAYDIWGDTVNTAARVEANSQPSRVNISETTYNLIKYHFECEYRGKVEAKNKGMLEMYFVRHERQTAGVAA